jgi:hypothetical protein
VAPFDDLRDLAGDARFEFENYRRRFLQRPEIVRVEPRDDSTTAAPAHAAEFPLRLNSYQDLWEGASEAARRELIMLIEEPFMFMYNPCRRHVFENEPHRAGRLDETGWAVVSAWTEQLRAGVLDPTKALFAIGAALPGRRCDLDVIGGAIKS